MPAGLRAVGTPPQWDMVLTRHCSALWLTAHALPQEPGLNHGAGCRGVFSRSKDAEILGIHPGLPS